MLDRWRLNSCVGLGAFAMESSQLGVAAVAERVVFGMLAAAPGDGFGLGNFRFQRREAGAFV